MRLVAVETVEQQDIQAIHRMRSLVVERRTAQINQIRGLLLEYGIEIAQGRAAIELRLPEILEEADNGLSGRFRAELHELAEELRHLDARVAHYDEQIEAIAASDAQVQRLTTIPGLGTKGATALVQTHRGRRKMFEGSAKFEARARPTPRALERARTIRRLPSV